MANPLRVGLPVPENKTGTSNFGHFYAEVPKSHFGAGRLPPFLHRLVEDDDRAGTT